MSEFLNVYFLNQKAGQLHNKDGMLRFAYDADYVQKQARALSISLPVQAAPFEHKETKAFFSNLLPDEGVRTQLENTLDVSKGNIFGLLKEIGGECAGAVSLYSEDGSPYTQASPTYKTLYDDEGADKILSSLDRHPFLAEPDGDFRLSGAGAQDKLLISFVDGKIAIPLGNTPSTHIIKPPIKTISHSVYNEFFCMRLAKAAGLPVPEVEIYWLKKKPYYLIKRYDRIDEGNKTIRLHQEDFCQILSIMPEHKYENEYGPNLSDCFAILTRRISDGVMPGTARKILLQGVIFNFLIGNGDAHGKNFSLLYTDDAMDIAPFYDLLCTYFYGDRTMAMNLGGERLFNKIISNHFQQLASDIALPDKYVQKQVRQLATRLPTLAHDLATALNKDAKTTSTVYSEICKGINWRAKRILK